MIEVRAHITALRHQAEYAGLQEKFQAIVGGFGSGKSQAAVYRAMAALKRRKWAVIPVYAPTYRDIRDINIPDFQNIFDKYNLAYEHKVAERRMIVNQGVFTGEIWFRSMSNPEGIIGYDATDSIIDEYDVLKPEKQREFFIKMIARMRGCEDSTTGFTTTPEGYRETYELFERKKIGPLIRAKTTDNCFLPQDYIDTLYDQYDDMLVKQYINAEFVNVNGLQAYYGFNRDKNHLSNTDFQQSTGVDLDTVNPVCIGMDFNVEKMCAEVFVDIPEKKKMHFFDEIVLRHRGYSDKPQTQVMCDILKNKFSGREIRVYPDASGTQRRTSATNSDIAILERNGMRVYAHESNPAVRDRLTAANTMLGKLNLTLDTDVCQELTEDLQKCERDKYGELDKSDSQRTHASDAATYPVAYLYPVTRTTKIYSTEIQY